MNTLQVQQQIHICTRHIVQQIWIMKTSQHNILATVHYYQKIFYSCTLSTGSNEIVTRSSQSYIIKKKIKIPLRYYCPWNHNSNKLTLENFTAWNKHKIWNFHSISNHIIYSYILVQTLYSIAHKHITASTIWYLKKLGLVGLVGYLKN